MISAFTLSDLPVTRWKNGAGETREVVSVPHPTEPFLWRASAATLQQDGPFSYFSGIDRVIVLLDGAPFWLRGEGVSHQLLPGEPWAFAGERQLVSEGITGPGMDFNIMTLRGAASASVIRSTVALRPAHEGIALVLSGIWEMEGEPVAAGSGIWWQEHTPGEFTPRTNGAALLVANIFRHS